MASRRARSSTRSTTWTASSSSTGWSRWRPTSSSGAAGSIVARPNRGARVADIEAHITGTVWKIEVEVGDEVAEGDTVAILESMKMEMPVEAEDEGTVKSISVAEGQAVSEGDTLIVLEWVPQPASGKLRLDGPAPHVARLTIDNPAKRNALDHEILDAIAGT